jgi:aminobenzoyl-glutamate utilization protein B
VTKNLKPLAVNWVNDNAAFLIDVHDKIWNWAEVGLQEFKTAEYLMGLLDAKEFAIERGVAGMPSAFVATFGSGSPIIGIMGELVSPWLSEELGMDAGIMAMLRRH